MSSFFNGSNSGFMLTRSGLRQAFRRLTEKLKIENLRFHDLRHEALSNFFETGIAVPEVQLKIVHKTVDQLMRHSNARVSEIRDKLDYANEWRHAHYRRGTSREVRVLWGRFQGWWCEGKFNATSDMMRVVSSYLSKNVDGIDIWPIKMIMAEFANIAEGGEAEFIKTKGNKPGHPGNPLDNQSQASLIAWIDILKQHGCESPDAFTYVTDRCWLTKKQLVQLRKDYGRGKNGMSLGNLC